MNKYLKYKNKYFKLKQKIILSGGMDPSRDGNVNDSYIKLIDEWITKSTIYVESVEAYYKSKTAQPHDNVVGIISNISTLQFTLRNVQGDYNIFLILKNKIENFLTTEQAKNDMELEKQITKNSVGSLYYVILYFNKPDLENFKHSDNKDCLIIEHNNKKITIKFRDINRQSDEEISTINLQDNSFAYISTTLNSIKSENIEFFLKKILSLYIDEIIKRNKPNLQ